MRRLAGELDMATMSLYSYVANKEELIDLAANEMISEMLIEEPVPEDWREALTLIARATRRFLLAHPWVLTYLDHPPPALSPNMLRHMDQSLAAVASLPLEPELRRRVTRIIDDYVFGSAISVREGEAADHIDEHQQARLRDSRVFMERMLATGEYPHLAAEPMVRGEMPLPVEDRAELDERFELGLSWLLDGIAAAVERG